MTVKKEHDAGWQRGIEMAWDMQKNTAVRIIRRCPVKFVREGKGRVSEMGEKGYPSAFALLIENFDALRGRHLSNRLLLPVVGPALL